MTYLVLTGLARTIQIVCLLDRVDSSTTTWMQTSGFGRVHSLQELHRNLQTPVIEVTPREYLEITAWQESFDDKIRRTRNELVRLATDIPV